MHEPPPAAILPAWTSSVGELKVNVTRLIDVVAEIRGSLTNMPTTFQVLTWFIAVAIGPTGLVYATARLTAAG